MDTTPYILTEVAASLLPALAVSAVLGNLLAVLQVLVIVVLAAEIGGPVVLVTGIGIGVGRLMEGRQLRSMQRAMLSEGICPGCAYDMRALEPGADDRTVCPECGAGWEVPVPADGLLAAA